LREPHSSHTFFKEIHDDSDVRGDDDDDDNYNDNNDDVKLKLYAT